MDSKTPPFQPGDRVIKVEGDDLPQAGLFKHKIYVVEDTYWCCPTDGWKIYLVGISSPWVGCWTCVSCHHTFSWGKLPHLAKYFRKVDEASAHTAESLLEELSEPVFEEPLKSEICTSSP